MYNLPDERGHFGQYGGVFVSETLIHALDELRDAYESRTQRSRIHRRIRVRAEALRRPSVADLSREALERDARRRAALSQARRPEPHRRAQGEQRDRPGAARAQDGQAARDRGNGRGPARRGHGDHRRAFRHGMRGLHGRGRRAPAGRERLSHEAARRDGGAGRIRLEDAEGRAERSHARLGDERRKHVLHHRHGGGTASVSDDGARLPARDRRRMPRADARNDRSSAGRGDRVRWRRIECDGHLLSVYRRQGRAA